MISMNRRRLLAYTAALPALGLARRAFAEDGATIRVASWGGSWRDSYEANIAKPIASKGVKVEFVLGNPDDNLAKQVAASRQGMIAFDVMEYTPAQMNVLDSSDLFAPLDYKKLPNAANIPAWARKPTAVRTQFTVDGIVYNVKKFKELGIKPPERHEDLLNPKLKGHVAFPDITNGAHWAAIVGLAGGDETNLSPAIDLVNKMHPAYFYTGSTDLATRFGSGEIWAAPWQSGWALRLKRSGAPIAVAYPRIGDKRGALWALSFAILNGSSERDACELFIDQSLSPEAQYKHCSAVGEIPISPEARERMKKDPELASMMLLDDSDVDNAFQIDWSKLDQDAWRERWNREVAR
jgi:putative spermidine/putrescine transport system substrate-binding protein